MPVNFPILGYLRVNKLFDGDYLIWRMLWIFDKLLIARYVIVVACKEGKMNFYLYGFEELVNGRFHFLLNKIRKKA